jgi:2-keto-3-deoxygluconate permease
MVVPLFLGMVLNTFFPDLLRIGGFTQALTEPATPRSWDVPVHRGYKMTFRAAPRMLLRGGGILLAKVGTATLFALAIANYFGGSILGSAPSP